MIRDCLFSNNAAANGGAVCSENSSPTIEDCHILGNYSNWGASAIDSVARSPSISRCVVVANPAPDDSAAIWFAEGSGGSLTSCIVSGSAGNMNLTGGSGVICTDGSSPLITRSLVVLCSGAGIYSWQSSPVIASNFVSANNSSGIIAAGGDPAVLSNTSIYNGMSGVFVYAGAPAVANNIFAFNMEAGVYGEDSAPALSHNCLFWNMEGDYTGVAPGTGDFVEDPMLDLTSSGSPKLLPGSPCIDAGDNAAAAQVLKDFDGDARVRAGRVDIGADETRPFGPGYEPVVVRVSPDGDDGDDGLSWSSAKRTVQAALLAAEPTGGQVWVQSGVYRERVTLPPGVDLLGGFAGTESSASQRDWRVNETTLDGMSGGPVITVDSGYRESAIDGFSITNGESRRGGGIECTSGSPSRIANCLIAGNSGAGIHCSLDAPAQITGNTIIRNTGEGVHLTTGAVLIARNEISGNGGTGIAGSADADIRLNHIRNNRAAEGAGGASLCGSVTVAGNVFADNSGPDGCLCFRALREAVATPLPSTPAGPGCARGKIVCANNIIDLNRGKVVSAPGLTVRYNCVFGTRCMIFE